MDAALEKKLRELVDRQEIWQVLLRYARGLDRFDRALVRSCYFDDCIEDHFNMIGMPDEFIEWALGTCEHFASTQHGLLNHICELDGDNAHCETYFICTQVSPTPPNPPHFIGIGRYIDHLQRRNGEWRFANRSTIVEGKFDIADSAFARQYPSPFAPHEMQPATRDRGDISYQRPVRPRQPKQPQKRSA